MKVKMIKLTLSHDSSTIYINAAKVSAVYEQEGECQVNVRPRLHTVKESVERVLKLISGRADRAIILPKIGSRWIRKGNLYEVTAITNADGTQPGWGTKVVYCLLNGYSSWSLPLYEWHGKMQAVQS